MYLHIPYYAAIMLNAFTDPLCSKYTGIIAVSLSLSLICLKFYQLFLLEFSKNFITNILILFSYYYVLFLYYSFALMFQVCTY